MLLFHLLHLPRLILKLVKKVNPINAVVVASIERAPPKIQRE
jgi:hypothetical protein